MLLCDIDRTVLPIYPSMAISNLLISLSTNKVQTNTEKNDSRTTRPVSLAYRCYLVASTVPYTSIGLLLVPLDREAPDLAIPGEQPVFHVTLR